MNPSVSTPVYWVRFSLMMLGWALVFSASLSSVIVLVWKGWPIVQHGLPYCGVLAQTGQLHRWLYTSCGCAMVELVWFPLAIMGSWISGPKLVRHTLVARAKVRAWVQAQINATKL